MPHATVSTTHPRSRGSEYLAIRYSERLDEAGGENSVGSRGDTHENALAESVIGLYRTASVERRAPTG